MSDAAGFAGMKTTRYFVEVVLGKRAYLTEEMCRRVVERPARRERQPDGRIRLWGRVGERWLRVVLLEDGETLRNAFFDRRFRP